MKNLQIPCIVCGKYITWDDSPLPAACATHSYKDVFEAFDALQQSMFDTPMERFVECYKSLGINVNIIEYKNGQKSITFCTGDDERFIGYNGLYTEIKFSEDGKFISQAFLE